MRGRGRCSQWWVFRDCGGRALVGVIAMVLCQAEQGGLGGRWDGLHTVVII
jgi:hypothetical protein